MKKEILYKGNEILNRIGEQQTAVIKLETKLKMENNETYHKLDNIILCTDEIEILLKMKEIHIFKLEKELEKL